MSGGRFDYQQFRIDSITNEILEVISENEDGYAYNDKISYGYDENGEITEKPEGWQRYSDEELREIKEGYRICCMAFTYAHRIDYLVSGDDSEESFHKRLKEDLAKIELDIKRLDEVNWNIGKKNEDIED
jgi:hypothetical protein